MWKEWLTRTLNRRVESAAATVTRPPKSFAVPPDFECDGMHPGADEFRAAMEKAEVDPSAV